MQEELDLSSTFVSKARRKLSIRPPLPKEKAEKGRAEKERTARPERTDQQEVSDGEVGGAWLQLLLPQPQPCRERGLATSTAENGLQPPATTL